MLVFDVSLNGGCGRVRISCETDLFESTLRILGEKE
jgi:hypothetical protein